MRTRLNAAKTIIDNVTGTKWLNVLWQAMGASWVAQNLLRSHPQVTSPPQDHPCIYPSPSICYFSDYWSQKPWLCSSWPASLLLEGCLEYEKNQSVRWIRFFVVCRYRQVECNLVSCFFERSVREYPTCTSLTLGLCIRSLPHSNVSVRFYGSSSTRGSQ